MANNTTPFSFMEQYIPMSTKAIHVLHHTDLDGKCSAAIIGIWARWNTITADFPITFTPIDYGNEQEALATLTYDPNTVVILVDFTCPDEDMQHLYNRLGANFLWVDHHKTNQDKWQHIEGVRDALSGRAACAIMWELCFGKDKPLPYWVGLLSDYDVWDHTDPNTLPFQYGIRSIDNAPTSEVWVRLHLTEKPGYSSSRILDLIDKGESIIAYNKQAWAEMMKAGAFDITFHGLRCIACNTGAGSSSSQMFESVYDAAKHDAMLAFKYTGSAWSISMYTTKTEKYDMGVICKAHNGGGHPGAAGFVVTPAQLKDDITDYFYMYENARGYTLL